MHFRQVARIVCLLLAMGSGLGHVPCKAGKRRFTVADDIGFTHFANTGKFDPVTFSPDGRYFLVTTERGLIEQNRPESAIRVFRTELVRQFLLNPQISRKLAPVWVLSKSTYTEGPVITSVRWLADSRGFAFLGKTASGNDQLFLADLKTMKVDVLTPQNRQVTAFDIRDRNHFVYSVESAAIREKAITESQATSIVATGRDLYGLVFPTNSSLMRKLYDLSELWAVINGRRFRVQDKASGRPLSLYRTGQRTLALSPDGRSVIAALPAGTIPPNWEILYSPPSAYSRFRIRPGRQDLEAFYGSLYVSEYRLINLISGDIKTLTRAPIGTSAAWSGAELPVWSDDGQRVALPNTFLPPEIPGSGGKPNPPCIAVGNPMKGDFNCVERLKEGLTKNGDLEEGWHYIDTVRFAHGSSERLIVDYFLSGFSSGGATEYVRTREGSWFADSRPNGSVTKGRPITLAVKQGLNEPPVLVATDSTTETSRVIWNPNPQFRDIDLGEASVIKWKDKTGHEWVGGLYKPPDYVRGKRYPLVVQTHGFYEDIFEPSGIFPTAFAARELAAAGMLVLQAPDCQSFSVPDEASCNVSLYGTALEKLVADGLVDSDRIGIVGFSRTCYYVMEALTNSTLQFKAASITDGVNFGYLQYILSVDRGGNLVSQEANRIVGAAPFGEGLQLWLKRSPEFNMDKISTPLQMVASGRLGLILTWEPYAALRYLRKPVDLIVLGDNTHVLTNPAERLVSQGGTVDWFRFWLKGEEDVDPAKKEQYARWREFRRTQEERQKALSEPISR